MKLIVAVNNHGFIGKDGKMMWKCKEDLQHFKKMTIGGNLLVGRKTADSIPYRKLVGRYLMIATKDFTIDNNFGPLNLFLAKNLEATVYEPRVIIDWVIGGAEIYNQTVHLCNEIHISHINDNQIGDTKFEIPADYKGVVHHYYFEPDAEI